MTIEGSKATVIPISGLAHIGVRVHDLERAVSFYNLLGFSKTAGPLGPEPVAILHHPSGVEINLILNAPNVISNAASVAFTKQRLEAAGISLSGGPIQFGPGAQGIFVRDPDRNVIELHQRG